MPNDDYRCFFTNSGADLMTQQVVDPKTGLTGFKLNPVFQTINRPQTNTVTNPLIPGGY